MRNNEIDKVTAQNAIAKTLLGAVPYIGTGLIEVFEYRSRVKQERINYFVTELGEYFESINPESIDFHNLKRVEFGDIFEAVLKRVALNRSQDKLQRFKKVLIDQILNPIENDFAENYLDLIEKLNEVQIQILICHRILVKENYRELKSRREKLSKENATYEQELINNKEMNLKGHASNIRTYEELINKTSEEINSIDETLSKLEKMRKNEHYGIELGQYMFYVQDLTSKALLIDSGVGEIGTRPYEQLSITEFGLRFLDFIEK